MATSFSIWRRESRSGLSFHRMDGGLDTGPVLLEDAVALAPDSRLEEIGRAKAARACAALPRVLDMVAAGEPGRPQRGEARFRSAGDWLALSSLSAPANETSEAIEWRLRAFGVCRMTLAGRV